MVLLLLRNHGDRGTAAAPGLPAVLVEDLSCIIQPLPSVHCIARRPRMQLHANRSECLLFHACDCVFGAQTFSSELAGERFYLCFKLFSTFAGKKAFEIREFTFLLCQFLIEELSPAGVAILDKCVNILK